MSGFVGAIDAGTTSVRFVIFDHGGDVVAFAQKEHKQHYPQQGWVEHDPIEIWQNICIVIKSAMEKAGVTAKDLAAIGVTNQRETIVLWDKMTGVPVHPAIVWQDTRSDKICSRIESEGLHHKIKEKTGLPTRTYFSASKLTWLFENIPELKVRAEKGELLAGTIDSWLIWNLTEGKHITDVTNASRTLLMSLESLKWDDELLGIFKVPRQILPEIRPSSDPQIYGMTKKSGPFAGEIPVCGDLGDQQAALVGQTCFNVGDCKNTYGTGCFLLMNIGSHIKLDRTSGMLTTVAYQFADNPPQFAFEGAVAFAGAAVQWLRDNMRLIKSAAESEILAQQVSDNGGSYFVPAFSGLFAPHWQSSARGVWVGLTSYIKREHLVRSVLESICFQTVDVVRAMEKESHTDLSLLKVDGGASANNFLMQTQADLLGSRVVRPKILETTSLGAAYAAGLAVGFWSNTDELKKHWQEDARFSPRISEDTRNSMNSRWQIAISKSLNWAD